MGTGVQLYDITVPGLFYANDMVPLARTGEDLAACMTVVKKFVQERGLDINYTKTEIMKFGPGTGTEWHWRVEDHTGQLHAIYLVIKLGRK